MSYELLQLVMRGNLAAAHILEDLHHIIQHLRLDTGLAAYSHGIVHHDDRQDQRDGELETAGAVFVASSGPVPRTSRRLQSEKYDY